MSYVVTNGAGQASFFYLDTAAGSPTLTATANTVFANQTETVSAGAAATIAFLTAPTTASAGAQTSAITIQVNSSVPAPSQGSWSS